MMQAARIHFSKQHRSEYSSWRWFTCAGNPFEHIEYTEKPNDTALRSQQITGLFCMPTAFPEKGMACYQAKRA